MRAGGRGHAGCRPSCASCCPWPCPGIICALLFSFTLCWNEFTYALTFISQSGHKTAVVGVTADLIRGDIYYWGSLMAGAVLASVPVVIVYVLFLDYYVSGLTAGRSRASRGRARPARVLTLNHKVLDM